MVNTKKRDFCQPYMIGAGTSIYATMDTLEEVAAYLEAMDPMERHFCRIYDRPQLRNIFGCDFRWAQREGNIETSPRWNPW